MNWSIPFPEDARQALLGRSQISLFEKIANLKTEIPGVFSSWAFAPMFRAIHRRCTESDTKRRKISYHPISISKNIS
jgi:hypothetical protein